VESVCDWLVVADIGFTQEPGADVDGTQFVAQVVTVRLSAPVVGSATQSARDHMDSARSDHRKPTDRCSIWETKTCTFRTHTQESSGIFCAASHA